MRAGLIVTLAALLGSGLGACGEKGQSPVTPAARPDTLPVFVSADGSVRVGSATATSLGRFAREDPEGRATATRLLQEVERFAATSPGLWHRRTYRLEATLPYAAPWWQAEWLFQAAARGQLGWVALALEGDPSPSVEWSLPPDRGGASEPLAEDRRILAVTLSGGSRTASPDGEVVFAEEIHSDRPRFTEREILSFDRLPAWLKAHGAAVRDREAEIETPLPGGAELRCGDVIGVARALTAAPITKIGFSGTPVPLPRQAR